MSGASFGRAKFGIALTDPGPFANDIEEREGQNRQSPIASDFVFQDSNRSPFRSFAVSECLKRIANRAFRIAISNRRDASDSNRAFLNR